MIMNFTVNELAKITNVSARNIRYYDSINLFKQAVILRMDIDIIRWKK